MFKKALIATLIILSLGFSAIANGGVPVESNGAIPINKQDQSSPIVDFYFVQIVGVPSALVTTTSIGDYSIEITSTANCEAGGYFGLFNTENDRAYFAEILTVNATTLDLDTPLDFAFLPGDTAACLERDMNVDGSVTPQIFSIQVGAGSSSEIDLTRIIPTMITDTAVNLTLFGDLPKLNRGLVLRRIDGDTRNIWNVKDNGELANATYDYDPHAKTNPVQGVDGANFRYSMNGDDKHGSVIRVAPGESLQLIVQDDLTGLTRFRALSAGHYVTD